MRSLYIFLLILISSCSKKSDDSSVLCVLYSSSGYYNDGQLILENVSPVVSIFIGRPISQARAMDLSTFLSYWKIGRANNFSQGLTKAGFVYQSDFELQSLEHSIQLKSPRYNEYEKKLVFDVSDIKEYPPEAERMRKEIYLYIEKEKDSALIESLRCY